MAICARAAYRSTTLRGIMNTRATHSTLPTGVRSDWKTPTRVLKKLPYCNGMKTGTTNASGRCLVSSGTLNGRTAIVVILGATSRTVWSDSEKLLRWALERPQAD